MTVCTSSLTGKVVHVLKEENQYHVHLDREDGHSPFWTTTVDSTASKMFHIGLIGLYISPRNYTNYIIWLLFDACWVFLWCLEAVLIIERSHGVWERVTSLLGLMIHC